MGPAEWPTPLRALCAILAGREMPDGDLSDTDWHALASLAIERHRVSPIVAAMLPASSCPVAVRERLDQEVRRNAIATLQQLSEYKRIATRLGAIGVDPVVLKGWPLAEQIYGGAGNRHSRDLDLFIGTGDVERCSNVMKSLGYQPDPDHTLRARILSSTAMRDECNDMAFVREDTGLPVELHWRCHHFRGWPELMMTDGAVERIAMAGETVLVPTAQVNLVYLSIHGSMHMWGRLKWLVDIARFATMRGMAALEDDLAFARSVQAWMPVALGLRLASQVLGSPLPPSLAVPSKTLIALESKLLDAIADPDAAPNTLRYRIDFYRVAFQLSQGWRQWIGVLRYGTWRRLRLFVADKVSANAPEPSK